ncbi:MAG: hypothetical protein IPO21_17350 [Bacteroidales bacterium]|nr:hypothetical protein [Bacteroidales bacterium]
MKESEIDESRYKADFMISENYIKFSSELLRLSLLAIGGFATLILTKIKDESCVNAFPQPIFFVAALISFVVCSAAALCHRYYATDAMSWYISLLRAESKDDKLKIEKERIGLHKILRFSRLSLIACEVSFGIGVILFFLAILNFIY